MKKFIVFLILIVCAFARADYWSADWAFRMKFVVDSTDVDSDQVWFPVLLTLGASVGIGSDDVTQIFDEIGANYKKIMIIDSASGVELYVEVEDWDDSGETARLWVSRSGWSIYDSSQRTACFFYYDNDKDDNANVVLVGSGTNIWDSNYLAVFHMADTPTGSTGDILDATTNYDGTSSGMGSGDQDPGKINGSLNFDDYNNKVNIGDISTTNITVTAWAKLTTDAQDEIIVNKGYTSHVDPYYEYHFVARQQDGYARFAVAVGGVYYGTNSTLAIDDGSWHFVAGIYDGSVVSCMVDGGNKGQNTNPSGNINNYATDALIGAYTNLPDVGVNYYANGLIDEVRISNTARSEDWLLMSYETQRDNFITWGTVEYSRRRVLGVF